MSKNRIWIETFAIFFKHNLKGDKKCIITCSGKLKMYTPCVSSIWNIDWKQNEKIQTWIMVMFEFIKKWLN